MFSFLWKKRSRKGFSLIEMIIVASLTVILGGAIFSVFSQGVRLWQYSARFKPDLQVDILVDKMTLDFHNAYLDSAEPFEGESSHFRFFTKTTFPPMTKMFEGGVRPVRIRYQYDGVKGSIVREQEEYRDLLSGEEKHSVIKRNIAEGVQHVRFSYYEGRDRYGRPRWQNEWSKKCLPEAVKVQLEYEKMGNNQKFNQIIPFFVGTCKQN